MKPDNFRDLFKLYNRKATTTDNEQPHRASYHDYTSEGRANPRNDDDDDEDEDEEMHYSSVVDELIEMTCSEDELAALMRAESEDSTFLY